MLNKDETARLQDGIRAVMSIPFIDDIEDFVWEAIFSYARGIPIVDPLKKTRSKRLFDVVDIATERGWSCKALQWAISPQVEFELVIQRADIFKKATSLGFDTLNTSSSPDELGRALLRHWLGKVAGDSALQRVREKRVSILLKSADRSRFAYHEAEIREYKPGHLKWKWTDKTKTGLQGIRTEDGFVSYRWYPNQKQLFERFQLAKNPHIFEVRIERMPPRVVVQCLLALLRGNA